MLGKHLGRFFMQATALAGLMGVTTANAAPGDVVQVVNLPPFEIPSTTYTVNVSGTSVPVASYASARDPNWGASGTPRSLGLVHFAFAGRVHITVTCNQNFPAGTVLSPLSLGIVPAIHGATLEFDLDRPAALAVQYGGWFGLDQAGPLQERLLIFADTLESDVPQRGQPGVIDVADLGVNGDGNGFVTKGLQSALDMAAAQGGGTVLVPPGTYNVDDHLHMRSQVRLHVADGALIRATTVNIDGTEGMIDFRNVANASLTGRGTITPFGSAFRQDSPAHLDFNHAPIVWADHSTGVVVRDVTLRDAANFHLYLSQSPGAAVQGAKLVTDADYPNTDGIDPADGSTAATIDDVFIHNTDATFGPGYDATLTGVTASNITAWNTWNGALLNLVGNRAPQLAHMTFENVDSIHTWSVATINTGRRSTAIDDIWIKSERVEHTEESTLAFDVGTNVCKRPPPLGGAIAAVHLLNITVANFGVPFYTKCARSTLSGAPPNATGPHQIDGVDFADVSFGGLTIGGLADLHTAGFTVNPYVTNLTYSPAASPTLTVTATTPYAMIGSPGVFTVSRSGSPATMPVSVAYRVAGSARNGIDDVALSGVATIPAGQASTTVPVTPLAGPAGVTSVEIILQPRPLDGSATLGPQAKAAISIVR